MQQNREKRLQAVQSLISYVIRCTQRKNYRIWLPEGTENVVVISCGLGIQTIADLSGKPVVAASNTLNYRGHHGMALTKRAVTHVHSVI